MAGNKRKAATSSEPNKRRESKSTPPPAPEVEPFPYGPIDNINPTDLQNAVPELPSRVQNVDLHYLFMETAPDAVSMFRIQQDTWRVARTDRFRLMDEMFHAVRDCGSYKKMPSDHQTAARAVITFHNMWEEATGGDLGLLRLAAAWKVLDYILLYYFRFHAARQLAKSKKEDEIVLDGLLPFHQKWWKECLQYVTASNNYASTHAPQPAATASPVLPSSNPDDSSSSLTVTRRDQQDLGGPSFQQQAQDLREKKFHSPSMEDIILPAELKDRLEDVILMPLVFSNTSQQAVGTAGANGPTTNGVLLFGEPGCGKTVIAQALAKAIQANFYGLCPAQINRKYVGESEKFIEAVFEDAALNQPAFIFVDEVDAVCGSYMGTTTHTTNVKSTLLSELSKIAAEKRRVVFIGATNHPEKIDTNFLRRFQQRIWVPLPDQTQKGEILALYLRRYECSFPPSTIEYLASFPSLVNCSGDDIRVIVDIAATEPLKELRKKNHSSWRKVTGPGGQMLVPVTHPESSDKDLFTKPMADFTLEEKQMVGGLEIEMGMVARVLLAHKAKSNRVGTGREEVTRMWEKIASGDIMD